MMMIIVIMIIMIVVTMIMKVMMMIMLALAGASRPSWQRRLAKTHSANAIAVTLAFTLI